MPTSCNPDTETDLHKTFSRYGFDYSQVRKRALKNKEGVRRFLLLAGTTDGAASEEYSAALLRLLDHWGEKEFLIILDSVATSIRHQALRFLAYEGGFGENEQVWSQFANRYPCVAQIIERESSACVLGTVY